MKLILKKGATSISLYLFIQDSASTTGAGKTGLVYNTASLTAYYVRPLAAPVAITLATLAANTTAWTSGGFIEVDATNMPGVYRLDIPNAVIATGANSVVVMLKGASGMAPLVLELDLVSYDPQDAAALGLTNLDATVSSRSTAAAVTTLTGYVDTEVAAILAAVDTEVAAIKAKTDNLPSDPASASTIATAFTGVNTKLDTIDDFVDTEVAAIKAKTDLIPASPAAVGDIPTADENAEALLKFDVSVITGEASRSLLNAIRFLRNKWSLSGGTLTVTKENDSTTAWTAAVTTTPGADPVTGADPT